MAPRWANSAVFYSADNGGTDRGSNWPLRGAKHSNWEGGMRVAAFVSGGRIPPALRGTRSSVVGHIADWYTTICGLAGVDASDDPPVSMLMRLSALQKSHVADRRRFRGAVVLPFLATFSTRPVAPLPVDPNHPARDIYAHGAYPAIDGVDLWPHWVTTPQPANFSAAHPHGLWLSAEVMLAADPSDGARLFKLVVAQQDPAKTNSGPTFGWKCGGSRGTRCNTSVSAECGERPDVSGPKTPACDGVWVSATAEQCRCGCAYKDRATPFVPCLFDVAADPSEYHDLSARHPAVRARLWRLLNLSNLEQYMHRADTKDPAADPTANRSPARLVGACNASCAAAYWRQYDPRGLGALGEILGGVSLTEEGSGAPSGAGYSGGPKCGVPGCE